MTTIEGVLTLSKRKYIFLRKQPTGNNKDVTTTTYQ